MFEKLLRIKEDKKLLSGFMMCNKLGVRLNRFVFITESPCLKSKKTFDSNYKHYLVS